MLAGSCWVAVTRTSFSGTAQLDALTCGALGLDGQQTCRLPTPANESRRADIKNGIGMFSEVCHVIGNLVGLVGAQHLNDE